MGLNLQLVRNRRKEIKKQEEARKAGAFFDELKTGPNYRRILPPWEGAEDWRKYAAYHFNVLDKEAVLCPKKTYNKSCPLCDLNEALYESDDKADKDEAKKIRAKDRFYCNVLNLDKNDGKVYIMQFGQSIEEQVISIIDPGSKEEEEGKEPVEVFGYGDITDPKTGRTVLITKTVSADPMQTSYEVKAATTSSPVPNWEAIAPNVHNLDAFVAKDEHSLEDLQAMADGTYVSGDKKTGSNPAPTDNKPVKEDFGGPAKTSVENKTTVSESFEKPKGMNPPQNQTAAPVEGSQPEKTMSAIEKLQARRKAQGA